MRQDRSGFDRIRLESHQTLAVQKLFLLASATGATYASFPGAVPYRVQIESPTKVTAKEATMELSMRLNVLAALLSFGFIAAIVFGMV
jgi:hypothetical protein